MLKMCKLLVLSLVAVVAAEAADVGGGLAVFGKIVRQFIHSQPQDIQLGDGVHLVSVQGENEARASAEDPSVLGAVEGYLRTHEIRIQLPELMPGEDFGRAFKDVLSSAEGKLEETPRGGGGGGGGKKGGGMGGLMLAGLMMGKMLAAVGLGGVGLLAMKALMVSALALMLSIIIGLKKLVSSGHDDGGGHTVIHAGHGHERRRRDAADLAYRAWSPYSSPN